MPSPLPPGTTGALIATLLALGVALAARALRRPHLGGVAAGIGILGGWWFAFGVLSGTPRQLPERLPLLMLVLVVLTPPLGQAVARRRWLVMPALVVGALWAGWWMAGAPRSMPDLARAAPAFAGIAGASLLLALRAAPRPAGPIAAAALLAGLAFAGPPGPFTVLGMALLAATIGAAAVPAGVTLVAALPVAAALAALGAIPVLARGAPADWAVAAAPVAALALGAPLGARVLPRHGATLGAAFLGAICAAIGILLS
jgi:hypothetical protein